MLYSISVMTLMAFYVFIISESASQLSYNATRLSDLLSNTSIDFFHIQKHDFLSNAYLGSHENMCIILTILILYGSICKLLSCSATVFQTGFALRCPQYHFKLFPHRSIQIYLCRYSRINFIRTGTLCQDYDHLVRALDQFRNAPHSYLPIV